MESQSSTALSTVATRRFIVLINSLIMSRFMASTSRSQRPPKMRSRESNDERLVSWCEVGRREGCCKWRNSSSTRCVHAALGVIGVSFSLSLPVVSLTHSLCYVSCLLASCTELIVCFYILNSHDSLFSPKLDCTLSLNTATASRRRSHRPISGGGGYFPSFCNWSTIPLSCRLP